MTDSFGVWARMSRVQTFLIRFGTLFACALLLLLCIAPFLRDCAMACMEIGEWLDSSQVVDKCWVVLESTAKVFDGLCRQGLQVGIMAIYGVVVELDSSAAMALSDRIAYNYDQISQATYDTLYMVALSTLFATIFGLPLGIALSVTRSGRICSCKTINAILGSIVNVVRSFPFIILIILLLPLSRTLVGTSIGATAAVIPLSIAAIPFIARLFEGAFEEIDKGLIEAALSMGASKVRVMRMMIAEAKPGLINAITITIIGLIGYSAMGGAVGAGGLGDVAIRLGFQAYEEDVLLVTSIVIIVLVQLVQSLGDALVAKARKMR